MKVFNKVVVKLQTVKVDEFFLVIIYMHNLVKDILTLEKNHKNPHLLLIEGKTSFNLI